MAVFFLKKRVRLCVLSTNKKQVWSSFRFLTEIRVRSAEQDPGFEETSIASLQLLLNSNQERKDTLEQEISTIDQQIKDLESNNKKETNEYQSLSTDLISKKAELLTIKRILDQLQASIDDEQVKLESRAASAARTPRGQRRSSSSKSAEPSVVVPFTKKVRNKSLRTGERKTEKVSDIKVTKLNVLDLEAFNFVSEGKQLGTAVHRLVTNTKSTTVPENSRYGSGPLAYVGNWYETTDRKPTIFIGVLKQFKEETQSIRFKSMIRLLGSSIDQHLDNVLDVANTIESTLSAGTINFQCNRIESVFFVKFIYTGKEKLDSLSVLKNLIDVVDYARELAPKLQVLYNAETQFLEIGSKTSTRTVELGVTSAPLGREGASIPVIIGRVVLKDGSARVVLENYKEIRLRESIAGIVMEFLEPLKGSVIIDQICNFLIAQRGDEKVDLRTRRSRSKNTKLRYLEIALTTLNTALQSGVPGILRVEAENLLLDYTNSLMLLSKNDQYISSVLNKLKDRLNQ